MLLKTVGLLVTLLLSMPTTGVSVRGPPDDLGLSGGLCGISELHLGHMYGFCSASMSRMLHRVPEAISVGTAV